MSDLLNPADANMRASERLGVGISVTNFGPIKRGTVNLRPLTVFVGPSNTGKTYFAILIYALHRILGGLPRIPALPRYQYHLFGTIRGSERPTLHSGAHRIEFQDALNKLRTEGRPFWFSDLPESVRAVAQTVLEDPDWLGAEFKTELERCFDLDAVFDLIRSAGRTNMKVLLTASEQSQALWQFQMEISNSDVSTQGGIKDMVLLPKGWMTDKKDYRGAFSLLTSLIEGKRELNFERDKPYLIDAFEELMYATAGGQRRGTLYLPAARSGIMQSHRVIASSLVARSTRAGFERFPELPTFSGVMADFMQRLILYQDERAPEDPVRELAEALEEETLAGQIRITRPQVGGYPEFVYRPRETKGDIRLTRASSMVSELAPVVLFLRSAIEPGDMLIIEEPEAHLHPAAQTQMAGILGRLVNAGVQVVVTTHSDWLLKEIGNLMREGELGEKASRSADEDSFSKSLRPSEVGVWLFHRGRTSSGSTVEEIPFDWSEGIEPADYEDVAETLYNRSANLQNRLEEEAGVADLEQE